MNSNPTDWCEALYEDQAAQLILYGRALGLSHAESEDVLQDTFLALTGLETPPRQPKHYALRAFRNRAVNHHRSLWKRLLREWESKRWFESSPDESPQERAAMVCLEQLPRPQREVIVLKIWHGHTFETIADLLEISPNTAAGRYRYGLNKMRQCLKEKPYEHLESSGEPIAFLETAAPVGPA